MGDGGWIGGWNGGIGNRKRREGSITSTGRDGGWVKGVR